MALKIGAVAWDDLDFSKKNKKENNESKIKYLSFKKDEPNQLRLITDAFEYLTHTGWKPTGDNIDPKKVNKWGYSIKCSGVDKKPCPLCQAGNKSIRKWYFGVIDRDDNDTVKIMDVKRSIVMGIKPLTQLKQYGHPLKYDIVVTVNEDADPQHYYSVSGLPPTPLSAEDLEKKASFDMAYLHTLVSVPTYEEVQANMDRIIKFVSFSDKKEANTVPATPVATTQTVTPSESEFTFPTA